MNEYGISLTHGSDRVVEYIAPSSTTPVNLDLRHVWGIWKWVQPFLRDGSPDKLRFELDY
ncbi:MAG: hypothetical protein Ct9H90mP16_13160 [Candidatus Poseidoniales archaeon]|nr:MAG: hypothetical protein Ct9H90mP16_13160 [Candidatus Poseidoniales archaeon]